MILKWFRFCMFRVVCFSFVCLPVTLFSQKEYFQQKVDYDITASLDTINNTLTGQVNLAYSNNSPDELTEIYFHLWTNAYKDKNTSLNKQFLSRKTTSLHFAKEANRGMYKEVSFYSQDKSLAFEYHNNESDVVRIALDQPIRPGESRTFKIDFVEQIPKPFSRMGHGKGAWQMSQWYPKPAVYDHKGWHPMAYLDLGEFYSEFGDFKVTLSVPGNLVVSATGTLQSTDEIKRLTNLAVSTTNYLKDPANTKPPRINAEPGMKTLIWTANNVHDFAWFANAEFLTQQSEATLESGKKIKTYSYFTPKAIKGWSNSVDFVTRAVEFYSGQVGEYPYEQATAVFGAINAGGGMEYPMITIINEFSDPKSVDNVITHEVGHNWFYGILASNERMHPWMDEGVNSFYEHRYMETYYPVTDSLKEGQIIHKNRDQSHLGLQYQNRYHHSQPIGLPAADYTGVNYGLDVYYQTATKLRSLENYLGTWLFDRAMQSYFQKWKFRHPYPEDMKAEFESISARDLSWFFEDALAYRTETDYTIESVRQDGNKTFLRIDNLNGAPNVPFSLTAFKDGQSLGTEWFEGIALQKEIQTKFPSADYYGVNVEKWQDEPFREDNFMKMNGKRLPKSLFKFGTGLESPGKVTYYGLPMVHYNLYDGLMAGVALHNVNFPGRLFEFIVTPLYGFRSKQLVGNAFGQYQFLNPDDNGRWVVRMGLKRFNIDKYDDPRIETYPDVRSYLRVAPGVVWDLPSKPNSNIYQSFEYETKLLFIEPKIINFPDISNGHFVFQKQLSINELAYNYQNKHVLKPFSVRTAIEHFGTLFNNDKTVHNLRWVNEINTGIQFMRRKSLSLRIWGGVRILGENIDDLSTSEYLGLMPSYFSIFGNGISDYSFTGNFIGRTATSGIAGAQVMSNTNGGFKGTNEYSNFGISPNYLVSFNLTSDIPYLPSFIPIKPYFDVAFGNFKDLDRRDIGLVRYSGGLMVNIQNIAYIYFPLINSSELKSLNEGFGSRITFSLDVHKLQPIIVKQNLNKMISF